VIPVGWAPLSDALAKVIGHRIPIHVWGACSRARGVLDADLVGKNAAFSDPPRFVGLVEWADKIVTE